MEELFVYSLLYSIGYEKNDEYRDVLDNLFCCTPEDEILLDLEGRDYKDAMLHLYQLMNELSFDIIKFGDQLMSELKTVYKESDIVGFSKKMYDLWKLLPDKINNEINIQERRTRNPMDKVFKIEDLRPIRDEMTVSRNSRLSDKTPIT